MKRLGWERAAALILSACAALQLFSRVQEISQIPRDAYCREESDFHVEHGEALLHGVPQQKVARAMPSYSVPDAVLCNHLPNAGSAAVRSAVFLACAALVFVLGAFLYSSLCGAGAALLYALAPLSSEGGERWLYALTVLLAAYFLVRRARAPSLANSVLLGVACGASLLVLSPLFLFPFLLVLYEWARDRRAGAVRARDAAAVCLLPFLFLIPWIVMNWRLSGRLVLFEDGRADENIITGALGFVRTDAGSGDYRAMAAVPPGRSVLFWAAGEILLHPLRYLSAFFARLGYAAGLHPLLVLASAGSIWVARKREDCRQLALLAAYFLAIHCLMPVMPSYFVPVWPLLAVLASGLLAAWTRPASQRVRTACAWTVRSVFAPLLLAQACVLGLVWAYPGRAGESGALDRELEKHPRDPWLWSERGMGLLRAGRAAEAVGDLSRAFSLDPRKDREINHAWALLARGGPDARIWERRRPAGAGMSVVLRERVLRAIYLALDGRRTQALAAMAETRTLAAGNPLPQIVIELVLSWPAAKRAEIIEFFAGLSGFEFAGGPKDADMLLDLAGDSVKGWRPALESLRRDPERMRRLALAYRDIGDYPRSLAVAARIKMGEPKDAAMLLGMASEAAAGGRRREARETLVYAEGLRLDPASLRTLAAGYRALGDARGAARAERRLADAAEAWLDRAEAAAASGDRDSALAHLTHVRDSSLVDEEARRLVLIHQGLGEYVGALEIVKRRVAARPGDARWRSDSGVLHMLMGRKEEGAADWSAAIALEPDFLPPYLSLGSLYAASNRRREASDLFRRALSRPGADKNGQTFKRILAESRSLP